MIPSPARHEQTKITQQQIQSRLKKVHVSRFPVVSNKAKQDLNSSSVAVDKHTVNERTSSVAGASLDPARRRGGSRGSNEPPLKVNNEGLKTQTVDFQLLANSGGMENKL